MKYTKICRVCNTKAINSSCPKCGHGCNVISIKKWYNKTKGLKLTPQEEALNNQIKALPEIVEIKNNQDGMRQSIDDLSQTIASEQRQNKEEFARGAEKFNKLEAKIAELEDTMNSGLETINLSIVGLKSELKDERIAKLTNQIEKRDTDDKDGHKTKVLFVQAVAVVILSVFLTSLFANVPKLTVG